MTQRFIIRDYDVMARCIAQIGVLPLDPLRVVTIDEYKEKRSLEQNSLYHVWCDIIAKQTGHTHDEIHNAVRDELLPPVTVELAGKVHVVRRSTTTLSVSEFAEFLNAMQAWAMTELNIPLEGRA